ncbi:MAG: hypothetical protein U9Q80_03015 [Bacillota bacterium]|nr:hypothetical protein [Bacillota bacterium]
MKKSYIIAAVVVVLIAVTAFALPNIKGMFAKMEPATHLLYASKNMTDAEKVNATVDVNMILKSEGMQKMMGTTEVEDAVALVDYANSIIENMVLKYEMTYAQKKMEIPSYFDYDISIEYREDPLLNIGMIFEPWKLAMGSEQLHEKMFVFDIEEFIKEMLAVEGIDIDDIDIDKYVDILLNTEDDLYKAVVDNSDQYVNLLTSYLEENIQELEDGTLTVEYNGKSEELKVDRYLLSLDMVSYIEKFNEALKLAKDDQNLNAFVKDRAFKIMDEFIESGDYMLIENLRREGRKEELKAEFEESKGDFDEWYYNLFDEMIEAYEMIDEEEMSELDMSYDMTYSIDKNDLLRGIDIKLTSEIYEIVETVKINALNDDVVIEEVDYEDTIDVVELSEDYDLMGEVSREVMNNLVEKVLSGDALNNLMMDFEANAEMLPEEMRDEILGGIQGYFQMLPYLIQGGM